jgi:uncharacterized protein (TIGR02996 family)
VSPPSPAPVSVAAAYASDGDNMLRAVLVAPEDDAPRLVYADWLDEHGEPERAEFIRVQIRLARWPVERCDSIYPGCSVDGDRVVWHDHKCPMAPVAARERLLLAANFGAWTDSLPEPMVTKQCPSCAEQAPAYETNVVECRQCDCTGLVPDHDNVGFRRGFVAEVHLTAAAFVGGPCPECNLSRAASPPSAGFVCPACKGEKRLPGLAAALFAAHPVTEVRLVDRKPASGYPRSLGGDPLHDGRPFWLPHQYGDRGPPERHWLPRCLILRGGREGERGQFTDVRARYYDSTDEAEQDLSVACVAYGRQLAGLPALT